LGSQYNYDVIVQVLKRTNRFAQTVPQTPNKGWAAKKHYWAVNTWWINDNFVIL